MKNFIKKAKATTWLAFIIHLFLFSVIAYSGIQKGGFSWVYIAIAIILPCIFFYQNIRDYDTTRNKK
jgi:hypothetical protein